MSPGKLRALRRTRWNGRQLRAQGSGGIRRLVHIPVLLTPYLAIHILVSPILLSMLEQSRAYRARLCPKAMSTSKEHEALEPTHDILMGSGFRV